MDDNGLGSASTSLEGESIDHGTRTVPDAPADSSKAPAIAVGPGEEVELKLRAADNVVLDQLAASPTIGPGVTLGSVRRRRVADRYLDTPDRAFLRAGFVLRERSSDDGKQLLTLKGLRRRKEVDANDEDKDMHRRLEVEGPLHGPAIGPDRSPWPGAVLDLALVICGQRLDDLEPVASIDQLRRQRDVTAHGREVGELSLDEVNVADGDVFVTSWHEVELEIVAGAPGWAARAAIEALRAADGLSRGGDGKFQQALSALASHPPGEPAAAAGIQPTMAMSEAGRLMWREQLVAVLLNEAGSRRGDDIEYVHDMRVALRRARAAYRVFGPFFKRKETKKLVRHMQRTARLLGAVRDLDVALHKLERYQRTLDVDEAAALNRLATRWRADRRSAYEALLPWLDDRRHRDWVKKMVAFTATPGFGAMQFDTIPGESPPATQVRHVLPGAIWDNFSKVRVYEAQIEGSDLVQEATMHALRIDAKRLRYSLEPVRHLLGTPGEQLVKQLKGLQDHLGDLNDASVTRDTLSQLREGGFIDPAVDHYISVQEEEIERLRASFAKVWSPFIALANRERLAAALAQL